MAGSMLALYFATLGILASFGVHRLCLALLALRAKGRAPTPPPSLGELPHVVVQLPIYNEAFVAERAIRAASTIDWPRDRLELQVLDDSTDETTALVTRIAEELRKEGVNVTVLHREDRTGFKAGALAAGLEQSAAPVVAIFDADFVAPRDFLLRLVPELLADPQIGMVQARWSHLNREHSALTRAQALLLDAHFGVEHEARAAAGRCFNFNGTAGLWRREAIEQAGGWSHDTITEDLDLSYRAQLAGWRFVYRDQVLVPAELPESWSAFRAQQARWARGSIETFRKHHRALPHADWSAGKKLEALLHLAGNFAYLWMAVLAVLLPAAVILRDRLGWRVPGGQLLLSALDLTMLGAGTCATVFFYLVSMRSTPASAGKPRLLDLAFALCVGAGLSLSNAREVLAGLHSRRSEFVRTPKRGEAERRRALTTYRPQSRRNLALLELVFAAFFALAIGYALDAALWGAIPFLLLYFVGFASVSGGVLKEELELAAGAREGPVVVTSDPRTG